MAQTKKVKAVGSRREVMSGSANHTSGGLKKKDLMMHKGRIVSRKAHAAGKKAIKRLFSLGYKPTKGKFVAMRKSMVDGRRRRKGSRKTRGGMAGIPAEFASGADKALSSLLGM
jgi:hypothetical protein